MKIVIVLACFLGKHNAFPLYLNNYASNSVEFLGYSGLGHNVVSYRQQALPYVPSYAPVYQQQPGLRVTQQVARQPSILMPAHGPMNPQIVMPVQWPMEPPSLMPAQDPMNPQVFFHNLGNLPPQVVLTPQINLVPNGPSQQDQAPQSPNQPPQDPQMQPQQPRLPNQVLPRQHNQGFPYYFAYQFPQQQSHLPKPTQLPGEQQTQQPTNQPASGSLQKISPLEGQGILSEASVAPTTPAYSDTI
ncbi:activating signal cointegrator 1 complex subunit 2 homolog [Polyodon spathula]|uniref:activating signal cointegrator 1 complex subunit 2 homolog n=1 Tax=Polyodon spathula TaxID=7913 RepID=UPI001B7DAE6A|nr:activating signal cointegrator 1 complex subunit 2 homolog [Polyodon spathula]